MRFKTERDFKAEELYELIETKYAEQLKAMVAEMNECAQSSESILDGTASIANRIVYGKCLLDAVHRMELSIEEVEQMLQLMSSENAISNIIELLISFNAEPTTNSVERHLRYVTHTLLWYGKTVTKEECGREKQKE